MPRAVNEKEHALKRNQILDVTQRLIYTKGYEQMAIQDILDEIRISKGAFYHYFDSKPVLLEALLARMQEESKQALLPIVQDPHLSALEKLQRFFDTSVRWKTARKAFLIELLRVWYTDHNAIVRQKLWANMIKETMPMIVAIFHQGIREGVLDIPFPDQIGGVFLSVIQSMGDAWADLLLMPDPPDDQLQRAERLIAAYNHALERVLGAPAGSIQLMDAESLHEWFDAPVGNAGADDATSSHTNHA
ncbi:MAG: TetR/AcrR family transcriptional regulator [Blastochloris sp.]|nr:TetR/AcrR family transcriptional regulator [Blastochloris sp.]